LHQKFSSQNFISIIAEVRSRHTFLSLNIFFGILIFLHHFNAIIGEKKTKRYE
jgi:hypothetical protein